MTFAASRGAYDAYMGRYADLLAPRLIAFAGVQSGDRVADVGCGPGSLTEALGEVVGPEHVAAVEPSESFAAAAAERVPAADVQVGAAESLPWPADTFDVALAQLVVHFMADPIVGVREMARVTRPGGVVAACVWDHAGRRGPLSLFWTAVRQLEPAAQDESELAGARAGHLAELVRAAGIHDVNDTELAARVEYASFEDWWEPFTLGVGPAGAYTAGLDAVRREKLKERCRELVPAAPFTLEAVAWAAHGHTSPSV